MNSIKIIKVSNGELDSIADLWLNMMEFYEMIEKDVRYYKDSKERYLHFLKSIDSSPDYNLLSAKKDNRSLGYIIGSILHRPPVIIPGYMGKIIDFWILSEIKGDARYNICKCLLDEIGDWYKKRGILKYSIELSVNNTVDNLLLKKNGMECIKKVYIKKI